MKKGIIVACMILILILILTASVVVFASIEKQAFYVPKSEIIECLDENCYDEHDHEQTLKMFHFNVSEGMFSKLNAEIEEMQTTLNDFVFDSENAFTEGNRYLSEPNEAISAMSSGACPLCRNSLITLWDRYNITFDCTDGHPHCWVFYTYRAEVTRCGWVQCSYRTERTILESVQHIPVMR